MSSYLTHLAPLTGVNAASYVGVAWINGHRVQEVINPRSGNAWATVPGTAGGADRGTTSFVGPTAQFTSGSANDQNQRSCAHRPRRPADQLPDRSLATSSPTAPIWILTKGGQTGGGTFTIGWTPSGPPVVPTASATIQVEDPVQSQNAGDRSAALGKNGFPFNSSQASFRSAYNQTDVKGEIVNLGPNLAPVAAGQLELRRRDPEQQDAVGDEHLSRRRYRVWNRFEDLGAQGYAGELYTDRTTGSIYYTPRTDLGETCSTINGKGQAIIPSTLETLLKVSSAPADIATAGVGAAGATVGNFVFKDILFEHTQHLGLHGSSQPHRRRRRLFDDAVTSHYAGPLSWAVRDDRREERDVQRRDDGPFRRKRACRSHGARTMTRSKTASFTTRAAP